MRVLSFAVLVSLLLVAPLARPAAAQAPSKFPPDSLVNTKVIMRDLLESDEWRNTKARVPLALGKDVYGHPIVADLAEMTRQHVTVALSGDGGDELFAGYERYRAVKIAQIFDRLPRLLRKVIAAQNRDIKAADSFSMPQPRNPAAPSVASSSTNRNPVRGSA